MLHSEGSVKDFSVIGFRYNIGLILRIHRVLEKLYSEGSDQVNPTEFRIFQ